MESDERRNTLITLIKEQGSWARITDNTWCIKSDETKSSEVRDKLAARVAVKNTERLLVVNMTYSAWASYYLPKEVTDWLKE